MRLFGILILIYILIIFMQSNSTKEKYISILVLSLSIGLYIQIGYFFALNSFDISYSFFLEIVLFIFSVYLILKGQMVSRNTLRNIIFLASVLMVNLILIWLIPYQKPMLTHGTSIDSYVLGNANKELVSFGFSNVLMAIKILMLAVVLMVARQLLKEEICYVLKQLSRIGKLYFIYCMLECILKNVFQSDILYRIQEIVFGVAGATQTEIRARGGIYTLQGLAREPSHLALQLLIIIVLLLCQQKIEKKSNALWIFGGLFFLVVGMSLTSFLCLLSLGLLFYLSKSNLLIRIRIIGAVVLSFAAIAIIGSVFWDYFLNNSYYVKRILNLLVDIPNILNGSWVNFSNREISNRARIVSLVEGIKVFFDRPFWGTGVGTSGCMSDIIAFLGNVGIIGLYAWLRAVPLGSGIKSKKYKWALFICLLPYFFVVSENMFWTLPAMVLYIALERLYEDKEKIEQYNYEEDQYHCSGI